MHDDGFDADAEVLALLRGARLDPEALPPAEALAWLLGRCVVIDSRRIGSPMLQPSSREIWLPSSWRGDIREWAILHELDELRGEELRLPHEQREAFAQSFAGALQAPAPLVRRALHVLGFDLPTLATALRTTQSVTALRVGEVGGAPVALITTRSVHARGRSWRWPPEETLRRVAREGGCEGIEHVQVTDAPRRSVLRAA